MKKWILNRFFKQDLLDAKIVAFRDAQKDILETMADDLDVKANELAQKKLEALLSPIDWNSVVRYNVQTKQIYIGNDLIDNARMANLKAERNFLLESDMWKLLVETTKAEAEQSMFVKGETLADMQKGKAMLFTLDMLRNILNKFQ